MFALLGSLLVHHINYKALVLDLFRIKLVSLLLCIIVVFPCLGLLDNHVIDAVQVNRVALVETDVGVAHQVDFELLVEVLRQHDVDLLGGKTLESDSLHSKEFITSLDRDKEEPAAVFGLREVTDSHELLGRAVSAPQVHHQNSLVSFTEWLIGQDSILGVCFGNGILDVDDGNLV